MGAESLVVPVGAGHADDRYAQPPGAGEFVDGRDEFLADQVTGRAEQDQRVCARFHDNPPLRMDNSDCGGIAVAQAVAAGLMWV